MKIHVSELSKGEGKERERVGMIVLDMVWMLDMNFGMVS